MKKYSLATLFCLYLLWPCYQIVDFISIQPFASVWDCINYAASIAAYNWLMLNVLLALKLPLVQKLLPYDFRIRAHIFSTMGIAVFLLFHGIYYGIVLAKALDWVVWTLIVLLVLLVVLSVLWIPTPGFRRFRDGVMGKISWFFFKSYDSQKLVHKGLFVVLAVLAYIHIVNSEIMDVVSPASAWGFQGLAILTALAFVLTRIHNRLMPTLQIQEITNRGGTTSIVLNAHPLLRYRAGQFAFLRFRHPELRGEEHPFSFTSSPREDTVEFAVRELGDFTRKLGLLKPGDKVKVNGGFGAFRPHHTHAPLVLIGTGVGAAPMMSILKDLAFRQPDRVVTCYISALSRNQLIDAESLEEIRKTMPHLDLHILIEDEGAPRFSMEMFASDLGSPRGRAWYICSSAKVRQITLGILKDLGVPRRKIHFEAFNFG